MDQEVKTCDDRKEAAPAVDAGWRERAPLSGLMRQAGKQRATGSRSETKGAALAVSCLYCRKQQRRLWNGILDRDRIRLGWGNWNGEPMDSRTRGAISSPLPLSINS